VLFKLIVIGEASGRVSAGLRTSRPDIPWGQIVTFRNFARATRRTQRPRTPRRRPAPSPSASHHTARSGLSSPTSARSPP
jgi:hypothetical protein